MKRSIAIYGAALAGAAFALRWMEYRHSVRMLSTELYIVCIAVLFTGIGIWVGRRLAARSSSATFDRNERALQSLAISDREYDVLVLLARGHTNQQIAERLFVSPNTIKTHLGNLYAKLGVSRRTQAVQKSRALRLIP